MEERKELIYAAETVELFPAMDAVEREEVRTVTLAPRRRGMAGVMIAVALFTMAFLLCESMHGIRRMATEGEAAEWLSHLMTESILESSQTQSSPSMRPTVATTQPSDERAENALPHVSETAGKELEQIGLSAEELYTYDLSTVPAGMIPIVPMDLSLSSYGESFLYNDTSYKLSASVTAAENASIPTSAEAGEVSVLILHTHATEGYSGEDATWYDPDTPLARAEDPETGVIAVGKAMAKYLNERGIVTLHSTTLHDAESYKDSYSRSAQTVQSYLKQYPSIRLVIDVHRDSILTSKDQLVRPVTVVNGEAVAQIMCVVGSDAAGGTYSNWQDNFALALRLRNQINGLYGNLARPVYVKKSTYNQQYAPSSLLLEIGSSGNTLEEAIRAGLLVAEQIAQMLA